MCADRCEHVGAIIGGKYKLIEEIGEGGMGSAHMAQQTEPVKRAVAVKVIADFCDQRKLTPRQRLELFVPVSQAIQHAHQSGGPTRSRLRSSPIV